MRVTLFSIFIALASAQMLEKTAWLAQFGSGRESYHPTYGDPKTLTQSINRAHKYLCYPSKIEACSKKNELIEWTMALNDMSTCEPNNPTDAQCIAGGVTYDTSDPPVASCGLLSGCIVNTAPGTCTESAAIAVPTDTAACGAVVDLTSHTECLAV